MPKVSDEELARRQARILDGARHCFARYGYAGATVNRLEQEIGLTRGAIFHHFGDKLGLFVAVATRQAERAGEQLAREGIVETLVTLLHEDPDWLITSFEMGRLYRTDPEFRERWEQRGRPIDDALPAIINRGQAGGTVRSDVPTEVLTRFVGIVADGIAAQRAFMGDVPDAEEALQLVEDALRPR